MHVQGQYSQVCKNDIIIPMTDTQQVQCISGQYSDCEQDLGAHCH